PFAVLPGQQDARQARRELCAENGAGVRTQGSHLLNVFRSILDREGRNAVLVSIYRYNPETDAKPRMQDYQVELPQGKDLMVLDVLQLVKDQDSSLTYRRSCREGVCGSDGLNMNGKNGLACITHVSSIVKNDKLVIRP